MIKPQRRRLSFSERVLTLHNGDKNDDDEEEEGDVVEHPRVFQFISIRRLQLVTDTTTGSHTGVEVVDEALKTLSQGEE